MDATLQQLPLIPRTVLFGNPDKVLPTLSPDGRLLAYLAPRDGVLNIWLRTPGQQDDRPLTHDTGRGIRNYNWCFDGEHVLYRQDRDGDENFLLYSTSVRDGSTTCLTPPEPGDKHPLRVEIMTLIPERPGELILAINRRDPRSHDLYHLELATGRLSLIQESRPDIVGWLVDYTLTVRGYVESQPDGGKRLMLRAGAGDEYREALLVPHEDALTSYPLDFSADGSKLYVISSVGRDTSALVEYDTREGTERVLFSHPRYDLAGAILHPTRHEPDACMYLTDRLAWEALDPALNADLERIQSTNPGDPYITRCTTDDSRWLVSFDQDDGPILYYMYDRAGGRMDYLFCHREALAGLPLVPLQPVSYTSHDGLPIHGYLALPQGFQGPGPLVLNVHGGPWGRNAWGFDPEMQLFANRGYACLQVNFRGSTGYGKDFTNAGDREWGGRMQDDLTDAVQWAVAQGIADPARVAIYGGSYGGYATLAGVTFTPELYCAGAEAVGPSNMETFLNTIPPYWESMRKLFDRRVGRIPRYTEGEKAGQPKADADMDAAEKAEVEFMRSRSPLFFADRVRVPLLIAQGANDPRVKKAESDQFVAALRGRGIPVEYVVYDNEGHGFARPENRLDYYRRVEAFLAPVLGGRCEP